MDIFLRSEKIGTLQGAKISGLIIEGIWPGCFHPAGTQDEPYTLKGNNIIFEGCWLCSATGVANGSYVTFEATKHQSEALNGSNKNKKDSVLPNKG